MRGNLDYGTGNQTTGNLGRAGVVRKTYKPSPLKKGTGVKRKVCTHESTVFLDLNFTQELNTAFFLKKYVLYFLSLDQ